MKVVSLDFEMSGLNADFGILLCGCFKTWGKQKVTTLRQDRMDNYRKEPWNDEKLALALRDQVDDADIIVTWNGKRFDIPFLTARLAVYGHEPPKRVKHIDLLYQSRYKWKLHSNRLDSVLKFLDAPEEFSKTHIEPKHWVKALMGYRKSMDYIVHHCVQDVKALDWVYEQMKGLVTVVHP